VLAELESASATIDKELVSLVDDERAGDKEAGHDEATKVYHHILSTSPMYLAMAGLTHEGVDLAACTSIPQRSILRLDEYLSNIKLTSKLESPHTPVGCARHVLDEPVVVEIVCRLRL